MADLESLRRENEYLRRLLEQRTSRQFSAHRVDETQPGAGAPPVWDNTGKKWTPSKIVSSDEVQILTVDASGGGNPAAIDLISNTAGSSSYRFSDTDASFRGGFTYSHLLDTLFLSAGGATAVTFNATTVTSASTHSWDLGAATGFEIPNGAAPTVNATGEIALDTDIYTSQGGIIAYDGTQQINVVATTNTPSSDNDVPAYDSGTGTIIWQAQAGGGGTPGGSDTQVQFNDAGSFGGDAGFVYDKTNDIVTIGGSATGGLMVAGAVTPPSPDTTLHIWDGTAGAVAAPANTIATFEDDAATMYVTLLGPNGQQQGIVFGDLAVNDIGKIEYLHSSNVFNILPNATTTGYTMDDNIFRIDSTGASGTPSAFIYAKAPNTSTGNFIGFEDSDATNRGGMAYNHSTDAMALWANGAAQLTFTGATALATSATTWDFGDATWLEIPNSATPTAPGAAGRLVMDTNLYSASQGAIIMHDGTGTRNVVATTNTPSSDNDVPAWDTATSTIIWQAQAGGSSTPGGSDTQVQFNDGGSFGGDAGLVWDKTNNILTAGDETGSGASPVAGTRIAIDNNGDSYLSILSSVAGAGGVYFGDSGNNIMAGITYSHGTNILTLKANNATVLTMSGTTTQIPAGDTLTVDTINETTGAAGVTIDGVLLKDNLIAASAVPDTHGVTPSAHHTRSHAITGTSDHTAGNWKVVYTNGSGQVTELALGAAPSASLGHTYLRSASASSAPTFSQIMFTKSITVEDPTSAEDIGICFFFQAVTVREVQAVVVGSSTPSVTINPKHSTDRSAAGNAVLNAATAITNTTTGQNLTSFTDATIPADSFLWLETTAQSGTVDELHITFRYTID